MKKTDIYVSENSLYDLNNKIVENVVDNLKDDSGKKILKPTTPTKASPLLGLWIRVYSNSRMTPQTLSK